MVGIDFYIDKLLTPQSSLCALSWSVTCDNFTRERESTGAKRVITLLGNLTPNGGNRKLLVSPQYTVQLYTVQLVITENWVKTTAILFIGPLNHFPDC